MDLMMELSSPEAMTDQALGVTMTEQLPVANCGVLPDILQSAEADMLRRAGLRPTYQRIALSRLLFARGERHVTADEIYGEAIAATISVSLATVYNTLNQFTEAGLLKRIGLDGSRSFYDTNLSAHHHFFVDQDDELLDFPEPKIAFESVPQPYPDYEISQIDVVIHLRRTKP